MATPNKSLTKALQVLKAIMVSPEPLTANVLCQRLTIDKSTMSRLITTLMNEGFIEYYNNTKEIIVSDFMRKIVEKDDRAKIVEKTEPILDKVFSFTGECAYIGINDNGSVLFLNQVDKSKRVLKTRNSIGMHTPLHTNAFGKILLAFGGIEIKDLKLKKHTNNTITSTSKLQKELELIRERGYAIGNEEHEFGLCSAAVPYFNNKREFAGTIGISGLSVRLNASTLHEFGQRMFAVVNPHV